MLSPKSGSLPVLCVIVNALLWHVVVYHYHDNGYQCVEELQPLCVSMTIGFKVSCQFKHNKELQQL